MACGRRGATVTASSVVALAAWAVPFYLKVFPEGVEKRVPIDRIALANITADMFRPGGRYTEYPVLIDHIPGMESLTSLNDTDVFRLCGDLPNGASATSRKDLPTLPLYMRIFLNIYLYFRRGETLAEYVNVVPPGFEAWVEHLDTKPVMKDATTEAKLVGPLATLANLYFVGHPVKCPKFMELVPPALTNSALFTDPGTIHGREQVAGTDTRVTFLSFLQGGIPLHQHNHQGVKKVYTLDPDDILVNLLLTGEKQWALYPQSTNVDDLYPMDRDATKWGGTLRFLFQPFFAQLNRFPRANRVPMIEVTQKPGELVLFPQYALHGTWSPSGTLGVLFERGEA